MPATAKKDYRGTLTDRLLKRVLCDVATRCWIFTGGHMSGGYGAIGVGTSLTRPAHRESYKLFVGSIPEGTELHHLCENKGCCNPAHLKPVTRREHQAVTPQWAGHRTHCPNGHPLSGDNLVPSTLKNRGARQCATCQRAAARAHYRANKEKKHAYQQATREHRRALARARYAADPSRQREAQARHRRKKAELITPQASK